MVGHMLRMRLVAFVPAAWVFAWLPGNSQYSSSQDFCVDKVLLLVVLLMFEMHTGKRATGGTANCCTGAASLCTAR